MAEHPVYRIVVVIIFAGAVKSAKEETYREISNNN
jgi:hypothetical protein